MEHTKIKPFTFHGFEMSGQIDDQVYGSCVFCGKEHKFYISKETGQFDCKRCGESGNIFTFLKKIIEVHFSETPIRKYKALELERGIPVKVLKQFKVAFDGSRWLIPVRNHKGTVVNIKTWHKNVGMRSTAGCKTELFGVHNLSPSGAIWLCEGEWDCLAMAWLYPRNVVAVPGALIFKEKWIDTFTGRRVILCYDNDDAGRKGEIKARGRLDGITKSLQAVVWPSDVHEGEDLRDWVKNRRKGGMKLCRESLNRLLPTVSVSSTSSSSESDDEDTNKANFDILIVGNCDSSVIELDEVFKQFEAHIEMNDELRMALKVIYAHAFSCDFPGDPLWSYIVGPPGAGKTLLLASLQGSSRCRYISNLTPKALVSGFRSQKDPSLLPQWNRHCAVLKDFTEILAHNPMSREELYGTLRGAYDGQVKRVFGNGVVREYINLSFSLLAGVTRAIHGDRLAMMGERFLKFEMCKDGKDYQDMDAVIKSAILGGSEHVIIQNALAAASGRFLARKIAVDTLPDPNECSWMVAKIIAMSQLVAGLRANVERASYGDRELLYRPGREIGTRLAKQLMRLAQFICVVEGKKEFDQDVWNVVERVAYDSATRYNLDILRVIYANGGSATRIFISEKCHIPMTTLSHVLEDLYDLRVLDKEAHPESIQQTKTGRPEIVWTPLLWVTKLWGKL